MSAIDTVLTIDELCLLTIRQVGRKSLTNLACVNKRWFDLVVPELWKMVSNPSLDDLLVHLQDSKNLEFYLNCIDSVCIVVQEQPNGLRIPQCLPVQLPKLAYLGIDYRKTNGAHHHEIKWIARKISASITRPLSEIIVYQNGGEIVQAMGYEVFDNAVMGITYNKAGLFSKSLIFATEAIAQCNITGLELRTEADGTANSDALQYSDHMTKAIMAMVQNKTLKFSNIVNTAMPLTELGELPAGMQPNVTLRELYISSVNGLDFLNNFKGLETLELINCGIQHPLEGGMHSLENLHNIKITNCGGSQTEFMRFLMPLAPNLQTLTHKCTKMTDEVLAHFISTIASLCSNLRNINLNGVTPQMMSKAGFTVLTKLGAGTRLLESLVIDKGRMPSAAPIVNIDQPQLGELIASSEPLFPNLKILSPGLSFEYTGPITDNRFASVIESQFLNYSKVGESFRLGRFES